MMAIRSHQRNSFLIFTVVIVGLLFEWANKSLLMPNTNYTDFYVVSTIVRAVLLAYSAMIIYFVRGSLLLWAFMSVNMAAMALNILYLNTENFYIFDGFRQSYFSPAYRALELIILLWTVRNALHYLRHAASVIYHRVRFVATRWYIHIKAKMA